MKFEGDIENRFAKAIRNSDFNVNYQALKMASIAKAEGSEIAFEKIISENEITERLEDFLDFAPFDDEANFDLFQGGRRACYAFYEVCAAKPKEKDNDVWLSTEEKWEVLPNIDLYMSTITGVEGNERARAEINISKTQYEMYNKMLEADVFDMSIALSIHTMSAVLDKLSPEYVKNHMTHEDVKAIVVTLDDKINDDLVYSDLSYEVGRFVNASRLSTRKPHVLFNVMTTFANATANGETEEEVLRNLHEVGMVDDKVLKKYCAAIQQQKAKIEFYDLEEEDDEILYIPPDNSFRPLAVRVDESLLSDEEKKYFNEVLQSGDATPDDIEYITKTIDRKNVTDEEMMLMDEFDRMYDDEVEGTKKKRFGFGR